MHRRCRGAPAAPAAVAAPSRDRSSARAGPGGPRQPGAAARSSSPRCWPWWAPSGCWAGSPTSRRAPGRTWRGPSRSRWRSSPSTTRTGWSRSGPLGPAGSARWGSTTSRRTPSATSSRPGWTSPWSRRGSALTRSRWSTTAGSCWPVPWPRSPWPSGRSGQACCAAAGCCSPRAAPSGRRRLRRVPTGHGCCCCRSWACAPLVARLPPDEVLEDLGDPGTRSPPNPSGATPSKRRTRTKRRPTTPTAPVRRSLRRPGAESCPWGRPRSTTTWSARPTRGPSCCWGTPNPGESSSW